MTGISISGKQNKKSYFGTFGLWSIVTNTWFFNFVWDLSGSRIRQKMVKTSNCVSDSSRVCGS